MSEPEPQRPTPYRPGHQDDATDTTASTTSTQHAHLAQPWVIDVRGKPCPAPVLAAARWARTAGSGDQAMIISDDPATAIDLPAWARLTGNIIADKNETPTHTEHLIERI